DVVIQDVIDVGSPELGVEPEGVAAAVACGSSRDLQMRAALVVGLGSTALFELGAAASTGPPQWISFARQQEGNHACRPQFPIFTERSRASAADQRTEC